MPQPERQTSAGGAGRVAAVLAGATALFGGLMLLPTGGRRSDASALARGNTGSASPTREEAETVEQGWHHGEHGGETGRGEPGRPPSEQAEHAGFEVEDVRTRNVAFVMVGFAGTALACIFGMIWMLSYFHAQDTASQPPLSALQRQAIQPPAPNLQASPMRDINSQFRREADRLSSYAWVGHDGARVPIDRAMALSVGRPLDKGIGGVADPPRDVPPPLAPGVSAP